MRPHAPSAPFRPITRDMTETGDSVERIGDAGEPAAAKPPRTFEIGWEIRWALWAVITLTVLQSLIAKPFYIPSGSMTPTLLVGDRIIVNKTAYGWSWVSPVPRILPEFGGRLMGRMPARGDIVVVKAPMRDADYIKRVIAVAGDTVEVRRGQVVLNGTPLPRIAAGLSPIVVDANMKCTDGRQKGRAVREADRRTMCRLPLYRETLPGGPTYDTIDLGYDPTVDDMAPVRIPAGRIFLMGDNRDQSSDSRVDIAHGGLGGPVPVENLVGRADVISFSMDGSTIAVVPSTWWSAMRPGRSWKWLRHGG